MRRVTVTSSSPTTGATITLNSSSRQQITPAPTRQAMTFSGSRSAAPSVAISPLESISVVTVICATKPLAPYWEYPDRSMYIALANNCARNSRAKSNATLPTRYSLPIKNTCLISVEAINMATISAMV